MGQINPVHEFPNYFFKINFNIISNICLLLLLILALQLTVGFSLLSDSLPFRPLLTQLSSSSYPILCISSSTSSIHLFLGLPMILLPIGFHSNILLVFPFHPSASSGLAKLFFCFSNIYLCL